MKGKKRRRLFSVILITRPLCVYRLSAVVKHRAAREGRLYCPRAAPRHRYTVHTCVESEHPHSDRERPSRTRSAPRGHRTPSGGHRTHSRGHANRSSAPPRAALLYDSPRQPRQRSSSVNAARCPSSPPLGPAPRCRPLHRHAQP